MFHRLAAIGVAAALTLFALPVFADTDKEGKDDIAILEFETFDVPDEVSDEFYAALDDEINAHGDFSVVASRETNLNDLVLTLGCNDVDTECLSQLDQYVEGDGILYGSIEHAEGIYMVTMRLFDFEEGEFTHEIDERTIEADEDNAGERLEVLIEAFWYGNSGAMEVKTEGIDGATVSFDGEELGKAPLSAERLPLGEHVVKLTTPDGEELTEKVTLRHEKTSEVVFDAKKEQADPPEGGDKPVASGGSSPLPGWVASGVGAAGLAFGVFNGDRAQQHNARASSLICGDALCANASASEASRAQQQMNSAHTMSVVGYSVAAVGLAAGGYLLYDAYTGGGASESESASADSLPVQVGFAPTGDGAAFGLRFRFE